MSSSTVLKKATASTRVTEDIRDKAKKNLARQGLTISEYMRYALIKAANDEVKFMSFLDSSEALEAKKEAETGQVEEFDSLKDFDNWIDKINENSTN